jgi:hypothetical protein
MHQLFEHKIMWFILLGFIGCIILFCCFRCYIVPYWRERTKKNQVEPTQPNIMVNPMRIKQEKIMRMI